MKIRHANVISDRPHVHSFKKYFIESFTLEVCKRRKEKIVFESIENESREFVYMRKY